MWCDGQQGIGTGIGREWWFLYDGAVDGTIAKEDQSAGLKK